LETATATTRPYWAILGIRTKADVVLLVKASGEVPTSTAATFLRHGFNELNLFIAFANAETGEYIGTCTALVRGNFLDKRQIITKAVRTLAALWFDPPKKKRILTW
jgi:hypothetical protein